ncbi:MAG: nuclear transport factor 2 family protein [Myxococcota bacterium]|nr:nuclear transport factor 2 family protein [Myxococcota bacterium]
MRALLILALWALVACGAKGPLPKRMFTPSDRDAVKAVLDAQATAWNKGDLDGYMNGYAKVDWLVFTSGGKVRRGWQETYDTFHGKYAQNPAAMGKLVFEILSIDSAGADGAVVLGNWILTNSPSDGRGVFSVILERRPDGWKVIHDHTSSAPP